MYISEIFNFKNKVKRQVWNNRHGIYHFWTMKHHYIYLDLHYEILKELSLGGGITGDSYFYILLIGL